MQVLNNLSKILLLLGGTFFFSPTKNALGIVLQIGNNFSTEDSGALIEISDVEGIGIRPSLKVYVMPGENKQISKRSVTAFTFARVFCSYKEKYKISCDPNAGKKLKVTIRYENVLENKLPIGCSIKSHGNWTSEAGNVWVKKPLKEVNYSISEKEDLIFN